MNRLRAINLFLKIVYREWDYRDPRDVDTPTRVSPKFAWEIAHRIHLEF